VLTVELNFKGKNVVVTGGNAGIGLAAAKVFAQCGANVAVCARREDKLRKAVEEIKEFGTTVYGGVCDVGKSEQLYRFANDAQEALGGIDIWVSNAGFMKPGKIIDTPEELWDDYFNINVKSVYIGAKIAKDKMKNGGVLINAASFASLMPSVNAGVYAATKAAISNLTRTLSSELAPYDIRVAGYIPGLIATDINSENIAKNHDRLLEAISLRKFGTAEDVAYGIVFLASEYASYISGTCLEITGGKFATQNPMAAWDI
jgi:NAD(P)-dependent dehydrogenase (short-subunit alcohol dehydrogenase family)